MTDLVVVSLEAWDGVWRRNQHLVSRLLRHDPGLRVLFVEPPVDLSHNVRTRAGLVKGRGLRSARLPGAEGRLHLYEPTKWLPRKVDRRADTRLASSMAGAARRLGMTAPVLWINDPLAADLLRVTGWRALYDITDDWLMASRSQAMRSRLAAGEAYLLEHCDHVVVCSPRLLETKHGRRMTLVPNAVDVDAYRGELPRPTDLPSGPTVTYVGTLHHDRLDLSLCIQLARALEGRATLTFVGPVALDDAARGQLTDAGARLLGPREHGEIPAYLTNSDVLVVPHVVDAFTDSLDPIKVYEYLAARRPVVSTAVAGFRELGGDGIFIATRADFADSVSRALLRPARLGPTAQVATWDERAAAMAEVVEKVRASD